MQRSIIVLLILFLSLTILSAQRFSAGATIGLLSSQFDGDRLFGYNKRGPLVGLNWYYEINKRNHIQFDIDYLNIGSNYANETRPPLIDRSKYTLLSIDIHAASLFVGYNLKFNKSISDIYLLKIIAGFRVSKSFVFDAYSHNVGTEEYEFEQDNLSTTFFGPEGRFGISLTENFSVNIISFISINNMIINTNRSVEILRPFYFGVTSSYVLRNLKKKKKRRRR